MQSCTEYCSVECWLLPSGFERLKVWLYQSGTEKDMNSVMDKILHSPICEASLSLFGPGIQNLVWSLSSYCFEKKKKKKKPEQSKEIGL